MSLFRQNKIAAVGAYCKGVFDVFDRVLPILPHCLGMEMDFRNKCCQSLSLVLRLHLVVELVK